MVINRIKKQVQNVAINSNIKNNALKKYSIPIFSDIFNGFLGTYPKNPIYKKNRKK